MRLFNRFKLSLMRARLLFSISGFIVWKEHRLFGLHGQLYIPDRKDLFFLHNNLLTFLSAIASFLLATVSLEGKDGRSSKVIFGDIFSVVFAPQKCSKPKSKRMCL